MMEEPLDCITVPLFTSVTVTGVTVVFVVIVAVPFMPGFNCCTDIGCPLTVKVKPAGTVISRVPSGRLTTSSVPIDSQHFDVFVSVVAVCLRQRHAGRQTQNPRVGTTLLIARFITLLPFFEWPHHLVTKTETKETTYLIAKGTSPCLLTRTARTMNRWGAEPT